MNMIVSLFLVRVISHACIRLLLVRWRGSVMVMVDGKGRFGQSCRPTPRGWFTVLLCIVVWLRLLEAWIWWSMVAGVWGQCKCTQDCFGLLKTSDVCIIYTTVLFTLLYGGVTELRGVGWDCVIVNIQYWRYLFSWDKEGLLCECLTVIQVTLHGNRLSGGADAD